MHAALAARSPDDFVAHWVKQTHTAVQRTKKMVEQLQLQTASTASSTTLGDTLPVASPTWAAVATRRPPSSRDETLLQEVKVHIKNTTERKAFWTTLNKLILQRFAEKERLVGIIGIKKLLSKDVLI